MSIRTFCVALVLTCSVAFAGHAQTPAPAGIPGDPAVAVAAASDPVSSGYVLGRDDVLEVGLLGRTDFTGRTRVQADGSIQLPYIGKVQVAAHTPSEVSDIVRKMLKDGGYFADPIVTVEIVGYASRYVTVLGAVGTPGLIPINRPYRVSDILARVGGVRDTAAEYLMVRSADGKDRKLMIRELAMGNPEQDPFVQAGDKIFAPPAETFYITGQVKTPGSFNLVGDMTVSMAIAKGGGLTESGAGKKVEVTRDGKKISLGQDELIKAGDVVRVKERLF